MINKISALVQTVKLRRRRRRRLIVSDTCPRRAFGLTLTSRVYSDSRPPSENAISDYLHHPSAKSQRCHVCCDLSQAAARQAWPGGRAASHRDMHATVSVATRQNTSFGSQTAVFVVTAVTVGARQEFRQLLFVECFPLSVLSVWAKFLIRKEAPGHLTTATHCKSIVTWTSNRQTANLFLL